MSKREKTKVDDELQAPTEDEGPPPKTARKEEGAVTTTTQQHDEHPLDTSSSKKIQSFLSWIKNLKGTDIDSITVAPSPHGGGWGAFASRDIASGSLIGRIPHQAIMSVTKSAASQVGQAVANTVFVEQKHNHANKVNSLTAPKIPCRPTREFVLWLDMCHGRANADHFHHPYLSSLPSQAPNVMSWSQEERDVLQGTTLAAAADQAVHELVLQYHTWMPQLQQSHPTLFGTPTIARSSSSSSEDPNAIMKIATGLVALLATAQANENAAHHGFGYQDLVWARGMYNSRRFPPVLLSSSTEKKSEEKVHAGNDEDENDDEKVGILLPVLDLLNHAPNQPITWSGDPSSQTVSFVAAGNSTALIKCGSEIYNNYGPKSNQSLMLSYGFALEDNVQDCYDLHLVLMTKTRETGDTLERRSLGTFSIHRLESPLHPQFPPALWNALNEMFVEDTNEEENTKDDDNDEEPVVEIGLEAIELLLQTLESRIQPFRATQTRDARCDTDVARYRNGQRVVLEEAMKTLQEMIPPEENEEDLGLIFWRPPVLPSAHLSS